VTKRDLRAVLRALAADVRSHYGDRLRGIYLVDTRGLYNENEQADGEVVVVLADGNWRPIDERKALVRLTYNIHLGSEVYIRASPVPLAAWRDPSTSPDPASIQAIKDRAEPIMEVA
jgi:hypothetical protein